MVIFTGVKGCRSDEIHTRMCIIYGFSCVAKKTVVDRLSTFQMGSNEWRTLRNWNGFTLLLIQRKMHINNDVHVLKCWTIWLLSTATDHHHHHHLHCAHNPTGSWIPQVFPVGPMFTERDTSRTACQFYWNFCSILTASISVAHCGRWLRCGATILKATPKPTVMQHTERCADE